MNFERQGILFFLACIVALLLFMEWTFVLQIGQNDGFVELTSGGRGGGQYQGYFGTKTQAKKCSKVDIDSLRGVMKSQSKEDEHLFDWFKGLCGGTYIEMGALDGLKYSNSHMYNKGLEWKGLLVELGPKNFKKLKNYRTNELAVVHAGVCDKRKTLHYVEKDAVGGIWEFMNPEFKKKWWSGVKLRETRPIVCLPLADIIREHTPNVTHFDFFSLDIEGAEFEALQSLDFSSVSFGILLLEADRRQVRKIDAVRTFLHRNGYLFMSETERSYWYINEHFDEIYADVLND